MRKGTTGQETIYPQCSDVGARDKASKMHDKEGRNKAGEGLRPIPTDYQPVFHPRLTQMFLFCGGTFGRL